MDRKTEKYILNILREGTIRWHVRNQALKNASKKFKDGKFKNGKIKWKTYWRCKQCREWFRDQELMEVDHIKEIGSYEGFHQIKNYIRRMYCKLENLQVLCKPCHKKKSRAGAHIRWERKKKPQL